MIAGFSSVWKFNILNFMHFKKFLIIYFSYSALKNTHFFCLVNMEMNFYFHGFYITNTWNSEVEKLKPNAKG